MPIRKPRLIESDADLLEGTAHLARTCPVMAQLVADIKLPPLRRRKGGFAGLASIILAQQLSVAAADTIERRLIERLRKITPEIVLKTRETTFRTCGVSRPKIRTLKNLAHAVANGALNLKKLERRPPEDAHALLCEISGIGPWTADVYIMFCMGHADGFAAGDLALQESARIAYRLRKRPDIAKLTKHAKAWSPWRGVAARLLWAYYGRLRDEKRKQNPIRSKKKE